MSKHTADGVVHDCLPWDSLLEYERLDTIRYILNTFSSSFFAKDSLRLVEREEFECSSHIGTSEMRSLMLMGHVGYSRREAFLSLVRNLRLRRVRDLATSVTSSHVDGDAIPSLMLEPLVTDPHTSSYRRWHIVRCAIKAGLMRKLEERREQSRSRLRVLLGVTSQRHVVEEHDDGLSEDVSAGAPSSTAEASISDDNFENLFSSRVKANEAAAAERRTQTERLAIFAAGIKETRVDIALIAATVPTMFIAWSYRHPDCLAWLRQRLFNNSALQEMDKIEGGIPEKFAVLFGVDPWLRFFEEYMKLPPRQNPDEALQRMRVLPITAKRAQIVLVNVDSDQSRAAAVLDELKGKCMGWKSAEVSLIALWAGPDGLQSEYCFHFDAAELPSIVVAAPARRNRSPYVLRPPYITFATSRVSPAGVNQGKTSRRTTVPDRPDERSWCAYPRASREDLCARLASKMSKTDAPLRFLARIDHTHIVINPHAKVHAKALWCDSSSCALMKGEMRDTDAEQLSPELQELFTISDFRLQTRVLKVSGPVKIALDPPSPARIMLNYGPSITCSNCSDAISLKADAHYRCLHCSKAVDNIICEACVRRERSCSSIGHVTEDVDPQPSIFPVRQNTKRALANAKNILASDAPDFVAHPQHHVLLRIPPFPEEYLPETSGCGIIHTEPLLWGEYNIDPLPLLCNVLIPNLGNVHIGVYCNQCKGPIVGVRWKCAVCFDVDFCDTCFAHRAAVTACAGSARHPPSHPMICVRYAADGDANCIVHPTTVDMLGMSTSSPTITSADNTTRLSTTAADVM